jgi:16S rRNA (uracil1498-N3)-methyltransferase
MATAIAKGSRMDFLLEKVAELGAARVVPVLTERGVVQGSGEARRTHWQRRLREACKQCGRNVVPELADPATVEELGELLAQSDLALLFDLGPSARPLADVLRDSPSAKTILCLIGPEGGFTEQEQGRLTSAGAVPVRLAPTVLRIETAAIAAVAAIVALAKA